MLCFIVLVGGQYRPVLLVAAGIHKIRTRFGTDKAKWSMSRRFIGQSSWYLIHGRIVETRATERKVVSVLV